MGFVWRRDELGGGGLMRLLVHGWLCSWDKVVSSLALILRWIRIVVDDPRARSRCLGVVEDVLRFGW